jgi:hypothetical protein
MATTKITSPDLFNLESLNTALKLPSGTTAERPTSPSTGEWRYNTTTNLVEFYDGGAWRDLQSEDIPPVNSENFKTILYDGTGSAQSITGVGFKPDLVWIKERAGSAWHSWFDSTRGVGNRISSNSSNAQNLDIQRLSSFDADGFSLGTDGDVNGSGKTFVAWCWKANAGTTSSNTDGTVTSTIQVNTKAGFSIIKYVGTGVINQSLGHGLGVAPEFYITKNLDTGGTGWFTKQTVIGGLFTEMSLNSSAAGYSVTNTNPPTSSLIYQFDNINLGASGQNYIVYAFHSVAGYSKIGSYTGTGSTSNRPVINTGFEPAFVMIKNYSATGDWMIMDNKRDPINPRSKYMRANTDGNEGNYSEFGLYFLSNGFQIGPTTNNNWNTSGNNYLYIAFAADTSAAPTLTDSFNVLRYSGDGGTKSITGSGFLPNLSWIKSRTTAYSNVVIDSVRARNNTLITNSSDADNAGSGFDKDLVSFDTDGFTVGPLQQAYVNPAGNQMVSWLWKANPFATILADGTNTSNIINSVNVAAGYSITTFTGGSTATGTVPHGLGAAPEVVWVKARSFSDSWFVYHKDLGNGSNAEEYALRLNTTAAEQSLTGFWNNTAPSATNVTLGNGILVAATYVMYAFKSITGFSHFGTYTGNGTTLSVTGLGFSPDCVIIKGATLTEVWSIFDSSRGPNRRLTPSGTDVEYLNSGGGYLQSFDGDGFTAQAGASGAANVNQLNIEYIYMAWKANPTHGGVSAGKMAYLVVAGGGSGGWNSATWDGAGGGGGVITSYGTQSGGDSPVQPSLTLASGTYTITIGAGGFSNSGAVSVNGNNSTITGNASITCVGGGGGGDVTTSPLGTGRDGGSGGGGSNYSGNALGGSGEPSQGYQGGQGSSSNGGGGGGAGKPGLSDGTGGDGIYCSISGTATYYAGGAAGFNGTGTAGQGGGGTPASAPGGVNTGGGGAGTRSATSSDGGSGIIILRLKTSEYSGTTTGSPTVTTDGDETVLTYTGSGTYVHS